MKFNTNGSFNKITIGYSSEGPAKFNIVYKMEDGTEVSDYYFLEEGTKRFEGLIKGYTENKKAVTVISAEIKMLRDEKEKIDVTEADTVLVPVLSDDTFYLESGRYRLGVRLIWGGGITYLKDSLCPVEGVENMINQFDTGRLVQQSYYGCGQNGENYWGEFMGHKWPYNPVQGGDKGGFHSRLIDVRASADSIYIKSQPRDWGKIDYLTPSYMENTYSLDGDMIRVDNRFVDFSGWKHPQNCQELPAFYTVSYFDRFTFYDGNNPWEDAELITRDNLHFWGESKYDNECNYTLKEGNTETWSAWVSQREDYGIGMFVPETDILKAGRYKYNCSKDPLNDATNYTAPLDIIGLVSYVPLEYSYLMTCGSVSEIRNRFKERKDLIKNEALRINCRVCRKPKDAEDFTRHL